MKLTPKVCLVILCLTGAGSLQAAAPLPSAISSQLDIDYPGWTLSPISKLLIPLDAREKYSNQLYQDFNGDSKPDYAVSINYLDAENNVRTSAIVFLTEGKEFRDYSLQNTYLGTDTRLVYAPGETVLHWVKKGQPGYQVGEDKDVNFAEKTPVPVYPSDAIEVISLGKSVTAYRFDGNGFQQIRKRKQPDERL